MAAELTCPKCHSAMRTYERNGIHIDQCTGCRGIFLDRGELEHLLDAEAAYNQGAPTQGQQSGPPAQAAQPPVYGGPSYGGHHGQSGYGGHHGKRRKGLLGELFD